MKRTRKSPIEATPPKPKPSYEKQALESAESILFDIYQRHSKPYMQSDQPGHGNPGRTFYCAECRTPWPCKEFTVTSRYGQIGEMASATYKPLTLELIETEVAE